MKFSLIIALLFVAGTSQAQFRAPNYFQGARSAPPTSLSRVQPLRAQHVMVPHAPEEDSVSGKILAPTSRVYNVNPWVSSAITIAGAALGIGALSTIRFKPEISVSELNNLNRSLLNPLDRWALDVQTADVAQVETFSNITQGISAAIPLSLLFMNRIKDDWGHVLLMYAEATSVTIALYVASPLGPQFQNRFRPSAYDTAQSIASRQDGNKRNSFYSGHVATASVATFFFAKVYTDYHPELGNDKYWFYAAAMVPPLIMGYFRIKAHDHFPSDVLTGLGIGALCGILIPELHRITCNNLNFGAYATPDGNKGLTFQWSPGLASK